MYLPLSILEMLWEQSWSLLYQQQKLLVLISLNVCMVDFHGPVPYMTWGSSFKWWTCWIVLSVFFMKLAGWIWSGGQLLSWLVPAESVDLPHMWAEASCHHRRAAATPGNLQEGNGRYSPSCWDSCIPEEVGFRESVDTWFIALTKYVYLVLDGTITPWILSCADINK